VAPTSFSTLRVLSFASSVVFALLLAAWLLPGLKPETAWLGWAHGISFLVLAALATWATRRGTIPLWLGVVVVVIGSIGPFVGTAAFVVESRRRAARSAHPGVDRVAVLGEE
jgi:hypothetical protein